MDIPLTDTVKSVHTVILTRCMFDLSSPCIEQLRYVCSIKKYKELSDGLVHQSIKHDIAEIPLIGCYINPPHVL